MNDTNILILGTFRRGESQSSSVVYERLNQKLALVTVKRTLSNLQAQGYLVRSGRGRSVQYVLTRKGLFLRPIDIDRYLAKPQQERIGNIHFNHEVFVIPPVQVISDDERAQADIATKLFQSKAHENQAVRKRELERFVVEMSWKSAQIEGNTYTLLDTERLLLHGIPSVKNTPFETQMILNQKTAFTFVYEHEDLWRDLSVPAIEKVHELVIEDLGVARNLRQTSVGITGTEYQPLGNIYQIREALESLLTYVNATENVYEKALMLVVGLSYIQPFADGNKRTARMVANGVLLAYGCAPISYRAVDETAYKEATLIFYEQNSIVPFKQLFIDQYVYSATHYNIAEG